ncbi:phosphodiesterase/alkaline phosphatase D-like protein [Bradyrhizobium sp. LM3.4]
MASLRASRAWTRRQFLVRSTSSLAAATLAKPHLSRAADRPQIAGGIQSGDASDGSAVIWARADRPARMQVECSTVESFKTIIASASSDALPDTDFTSKAAAERSAPRTGHLLSCALRRHRDRHRRRKPHRPFPHRAGRRPVDLVPVVRRHAGQGWGIDTSRGGYRSYRTMLDNRPDFFIHSGDHIYADCTIPSEQKLPNGETWRNAVTEEKSEIAHTLAQFRGNYKYNHLDENFLAFHAEVPMLTAPHGWSHALAGPLSRLEAAS